MISFIFTNRTLENHRRKLIFNHERFRTFSLYDTAPPSTSSIIYDYRFNNRDFKNIKRADGFVLSLIIAYGSRAPWNIFYHNKPPRALCEQWAEPTRKYRQRNASKKAKTDII